MKNYVLCRLKYANIPESISDDILFIHQDRISFYGRTDFPDNISSPDITDFPDSIDSLTNIDRDDPCAVARCFLLTDYDEGLRFAETLPEHIPVIAWSHDKNRDEELMGTPFLILSADALSKEYLNEVHARHYNRPLVIGETKRCLIRELIMTDLPGLLMLSGDGAFFPNDMIRISDQKSLFPEDPGIASDPENYLSSYIRNQYPFFGFGLYAVTDKSSDGFLGIAGYSTTDSDDTGNISYAILPEFRRLGYAGEVLPVIIDYGRNQIGFSRIEASIKKTNTASLALARKCGITYHIL